MLSVTDLMTCEFCPRKLFLTKVLGWKVPEKAVMVRGSAIHKVFEEIALCEKEVVLSIRPDTDKDTVKEEYCLAYVDAAKRAILSQEERLGKFNLAPEEILDSVRSAVEQEAHDRADNTLALIDSKHVFGDELWKLVTPKILPEKWISSDGLGVRGIIDRIEIYDDKAVPIEIKSGAAPREGAWPNHRLQLVAYSLLMKEEYPKVADYGFAIYLDDVHPRKIIFNPFMELEMTRLIERSKRITESTEPPTHIKDKKKCDMCDLKQGCYDTVSVMAEVENLKN
ncbi:MAG: PD-(D/E)XK nuclease family protein [Candidatus Woesearchaeota archaeon]